MVIRSAKPNNTKTKVTKKKKIKKQKTKTPNKVITPLKKYCIDDCLSHFDDTYCEVLRPTYNTHNINQAFIIGIFTVLFCSFFIPQVVNIKLESVVIIFGIITMICAGCCAGVILNKSNDSVYFSQAYYQPIVFNRKQQKVYIYYNLSQHNWHGIIILDMEGLTPSIKIESKKLLEIINVRGFHGRASTFYEVTLSVTDENQNSYPLFHHFTKTFVYSSTNGESIEQALKLAENKLMESWNWCQAYMQYNDSILIKNGITKHYFRASWPLDTKEQFNH